jgi:hypothetical protein
MKSIISGISVAGMLALGLVSPVLAGESAGDYSPAMKEKIADVKAELGKYKAEEAKVQKELKIFDDLDFKVFSGQEWTRLHESHSKDVRVHWPDGHYTDGIDKHIEDLKAMFVYAPDTNIKVHPVKFGSGNFTGVIGVMTGTFSKPMPIGGGKFIQPTGKSYNITMATIGRWEGGVMVEEWLFWDNATFMKQIGLAN